VVVPASVQEVYDRAGSADKRIVWFERSGHEMLRDLERDAVLDVIGRYLSERLAALPPRPQTT
jgi:carboxylesterase